MTQDERVIKRYVNDIKHNLHQPRKMKLRINGDIGANIHARMEQGESIEEIINKMGTPTEVAAEINSELLDYHAQGTKGRFLFLTSAIITGIWILFLIISQIVGISGGTTTKIPGIVDEKAAIFVSATSPSSLETMWTLVPFLLGCVAAYLLLKWRYNGTKKQYLAVTVISIVAIIYFTFGFVFDMINSITAIKSINTLNGIIIDVAPMTMIVDCMILLLLPPGLLLSIKTLIVSLRRKG